MIKSYFVTAWRSIVKSKYFSILNICGLALGLSASILIFQYVAFHNSYDESHRNANRIYRITYSKEKEKEQVFNTVLVYAGVGNLMKQAFGEVEDYCRVRPFQMANPKAPVRYEDLSFEEEGVYWADQNFFTFFSYPLLSGNAATVLKEQFTAVISESIARKYFGSKDPIGKTMRLGQKSDFTVTGVFKDIPANSHMKFGILASHSTMKAIMPPWWNDDNLQMFHGHLYVLLRKGADPAALASKFPKFVDDYINGEELRKTGVTLKYAIMPLKDIHLKSHIQHEAEVNGDANVVRYMMLIGIAILVIAWINYINLATSRALERAREVGVRKVVGAYRSHLIFQFLLESFIINLISLAIAVLIVFLAQPILEDLGAGRVREFSWISKPDYIIAAIIIFCSGVLLSGFYPALVLSGFKPVTVLKGKFSNSKYGVLLRKSLVVLQFAASVALIISTAIIYRQIRFLQTQDLGFDIRQTLVLKAPLVIDSTFTTKTLSFKKELAQISAVKAISSSFSMPSMEPGGAGWYYRVGDNPDNVQFCYQTWIDEHFIPDFDIQLLEGRNFVNDADSMSIIINSSCLPLFGFKTAADAIGTKISGGEQEYNVVGVVANYQQKSLKTDFIPIIISYQPSIKGFYALKLHSEDASTLRNVLSTLEVKWREFFPGNPFIYFFLDDEFNKQYASDEQFGKLFTFFSFVAVFIGCLGLLGLSSFMVAKRTREIGIRKVLGSSIHQIFVLLTREFVILIGIANVLAWPFVILLMDGWLNTFAYRIDISVGVFVFAALVILSIALITIGFQVVKAANANPVKALRVD